MTYLERFHCWLVKMSPLFCQVYSPEWRTTAHCFNIAACRPDGSGLFPRPSSGRKLYRKDNKGKLLPAGHTAEQWLTAKDCAERIAQHRGPYHVLMWSPRILVIDCDTNEDSEAFADFCKCRDLAYAFEPSNHGGHYFFIRTPQRWPAIFTNAIIEHNGELITIDSCFGPEWLSGHEVLYTEGGEPIDVGGRYETGGRVLKTAICKVCWDPSRIVCNSPVSAPDSRTWEWIACPYIRPIRAPRGIKRDYSNTINVDLTEGNRNVGLCKLLGAYVRQHPDSGYDDRLAYIEAINNRITEPLPDMELISITRSSFRWR